MRTPGLHPIYFHCGLHKTASTFLQNFIFPELPGIKFFGKCYNEHGKAVSPAPFDEMMRLLNKPIGYKFVEERLRKLKDSIRKARGESPVLYSQESILAPSTEFFYNDDNRNLHLLKHLVPDARIILFIRRQDQWLESLYAENYIKKQWPFSFPDYRKFYGDKFKDYLNWHRLAIECFEHFGEEKTLIIPYETIKSDLSMAIHLLETFSMIKINITYPKDVKNKKELVATQSTYPLQMKYEHVVRKPLKSELRYQLISLEKGFDLS